MNFFSTRNLINCWKRKWLLSSIYNERARSLFGLQETITANDLTNTYFEGQCRAKSHPGHAIKATI
jgi:hypothetical protein